MVISSLSIIETVSAFRRKYNREQISKGAMNDLLHAFFVESLNEFHVLPMQESVVQFSFDLILDDDLRTVDSLQLSAALAIDPGETEVVFVSADDELVSVAERHGLRVRNPAE